MVLEHEILVLNLDQQQTTLVKNPSLAIILSQYRKHAFFTNM